MEKKNTKLRQAFEEVEKQTLNQLPKEEQVIREYSPEFEKRMEKLFVSAEIAESAPVKRRKIRWAALVAAVMMIITLTFSASGFLVGDSMWKLFDFTPDPDRYVNTDIQVENSVLEGEGTQEHYELTFDGEPVVINYKIDEGKTSEEAERGLVLFLNGVRQTFDVKTADGKTVKDVDMYVIGGTPGEKDEIEISFVPNLGKKDETMALSVGCFFDPDDNHKQKCVSKKGTFEWHFDDDNDRICDECGVCIDEIPRSTDAYILHTEHFVHLIMKKDAPEQKKVCENTLLMKESDVHKKIYMMYEYSSDGETVHNEYDALESMNAVVYKDINKTIKRDFGFGAITYHNFDVKAGTTEKLTVNVHGRPGKYRLAFYIGTDPQPVFDGAENIDVTINEGKQVEIDFELDTTGLSEGEHKYYIVYRHIEDNLFEDFWWFEQQICEGTLTVK